MSDSSEIRKRRTADDEEELVAVEDQGINVSGESYKCVPRLAVDATAFPKRLLSISYVLHLVAFVQIVDTHQLIPHDIYSPSPHIQLLSCRTNRRAPQVKCTPGVLPRCSISIV